MKKDAAAFQLAPEENIASGMGGLTLELHRAGHPAWAIAAKRFIDILGALAVFTIGAPVFLLLALGVKLSGPGPVFFRQIRLGKDGRPFPFYKFRSMEHRNDDSVHRDFAANFINGCMGEAEEPKDEQIFKMVSDPRVTRIGAFLRRSSLDELPQFWNVLKGEMSLVGPRPPISYELEHYQDWHKERLTVLPGLTGLWQVSGRSSVSFDEMVMLDLHYIQNWSLALDIKILFKTLPAVFRGSGAY